MNSVQSYSPPRLAALVLGVLVFVVYQVFWRDVLLEALRFGDQPVPLPLAILFSGVVGYGLAMLGWLIWQTKGQVRETFRPTRGRIIAAFVMIFFIPVTVLSYLPWIVGGLLPFVGFDLPIYAFGVYLAGPALAYPITSMIVRHTYQRRLLRLGMFCLVFWTGYAGLMLYNGAIELRI